MCACIILRDGKSLTLRRAQGLSDRQGDREVQAARTYGDHARLPALDVRQGLEERSGRDRLGEDRGRRLTGSVRIIDLHCYPEHARMDRLPAAVRRRAGRILEPRLGARRPKTRSSQDFTDARRRGGAGRARSRNDRRTRRRVRTTTCRRCRSAIPSGSSRPGARVDPFKGDDAMREAQARDRRPRHARFPLSPDHGPLRGQRSPRSTRSSR